MAEKRERSGWRIAYTLILAVLCGGLIHVGATLAIPMMASDPGYGRVISKLPVNRMTALARATPGTEILPFHDPDQRLAICPFDLTDGAVEINAQLPRRGWSIALYTMRGDNFYTLPATGLTQAQVKLVLEPPKERSFNPLAPQRPTPLDPSRVTAPARTGFAVLRALTNGRAYRARVEALLSDARCGPAAR